MHTKYRDELNHLLLIFQRNIKYFFFCESSINHHFCVQPINMKTEVYNAIKKSVYIYIYIERSKKKFHTICLMIQPPSRKSLKKIPDPLPIKRNKNQSCSVRN